MHKGQLIAGRFELEAQVAAGGMGSIFRAVDLTSGTPVAVKSWPLTFVPGDASRAAHTRERALRRFEREAAALAAVTHPAVVRYITHGSTPTGEPFLVMHWIEGHDLATTLRSSRLPVTETLQLAHRMLGALTALHAHGLVHRDLKPANVMLEGGEARRAVLVDFGIARGGEGVVLTGRGAQLGTPCYMSPEQIRDPRAVDGRADVFALGCIVFECLTGARAFQGDDPMGVIAHVLLDGAPDLSEVRPDLPPAITRWAMDLLASDRQQRPFADAALLERVSRLLGDYQVLPLGASSADLGSLAQATDRAQGDRETLATKTEAPSDASGSSLGYAETEESLVFEAPSEPLIGRDAELARIFDAFAQGTAVVALWGPPGIGKTRLALEVSRHGSPVVAKFERRVYVDLSLAQDQASALRLLAGAVGARVWGAETAAAAVGRALGAAGPLLAVLDGVDAWLPELSNLVAEWRKLAPQLALVTTSRARPPISGTLPLELTPLATLSERELEERAPRLTSPSAQLFIRHATLVGAAFAEGPSRDVVERIVRELEGIPLAIELAAARVPSLGLEGVLSLCARPLALLVGSNEHASVEPSALHATLRAGWDSLSHTEREVLGACAVFCGSFSVQSAASVVSAVPGAELHRALQSLREKSMLRASTAGFSLFALVREFALSELAERGELERVRARHAAYAGRRASGLERLPGERELAFSKRVEAESNDLIAAVEYALAPATRDLALSVMILCALEPVIVARGPLPAFLDLLDRTLAASEELSERVPFTPFARLLVLRARLRATSGRFSEASADLRAAEQVARATANSELAGYICLEEGLLQHFQRELPRARGCYERAIVLLRPVGDTLSLGRCYGNLGAVFHDAGKLIEAAAYYWKAIHALKEVGDARMLANFLGNLALLEQELGALDSARRRYQKALDLVLSVGDARLRAIIVGNLGSLEAELADWQAARGCHELALALLRPLDDPRSLALCQARLGAALAGLGLLAAAEEYLEQAERLAMAGDDLLREAVRIHRAFLHLGSAQVALLAGERRVASSCLEHVEAVCERARNQRDDGRSAAQLSDDIRAALRCITRLSNRLRGALLGP